MPDVDDLYNPDEEQRRLGDLQRHADRQRKTVKRRLIAGG